jgi:hypothetical protein
VDDGGAVECVGIVVDGRADDRVGRGEGYTVGASEVIVGADVVKDGANVGVSVLGGNVVGKAVEGAMEGKVVKGRTVGA